MKAIFLGLLLGLQAASAVETATVEGIVSRYSTNEPLAFATVGLIPNGSGRAVGPRQVTDKDGRFRFTGVKPALYELTAEYPGLLRPRGRSGGPTTLILTAGLTLKDLQVHLTPGSVIAGRVLNENGAPLQGMPGLAIREEFVAVPAAHGQRGH